jgi:microcystin-dependent protein
MWGCTFAPQGWAFCDGQMLAISQNIGLFSVIGTIYGGDGKSTFRLPSLDGTAPMFPGQSQGTSYYDIGQEGGEPWVTLSESQVPPHDHALQAEPRPASLDTPGPANSIGRASPAIYKSPAGSPPLQPLSPAAVSPAGGNLPHNNMMPFITLNFCIALQGIYPPRWGDGGPPSA